MPVFRPDTYDAEAWASVYDRNEYGIPDRLDGVVVLDIGAHIGAFSRLCLDRGCLHVFAYEANAKNMASLAENTAGLSCERHHAAVWRSDVADGELDFHPSALTGHTGGGAVAPAGRGRHENWWAPSDCRVRSVRFDDVVTLAIKTFPRARLIVKLDCEGSEFPIVLTARTLGTIRPDIELWAVDNFTSAVEDQHRAYVERYGRTTWEAFQGGMAEHVPEVLNRLHILRGDSAQMRRPDADLVFLDAGHDEPSVRADIAHWLPQVKPGGFLAGHDYEPAYPGLIKAVDEMFPKAEHENSVWWTRVT
jgi:FkbM family methyltransferase